MFITLSDVTGANIYVIPIVPPEVSMKTGGENETLKTAKGNIRLIGECCLKTVSWSSIFPVNKKYTFADAGARSNGYEYTNFLDEACVAKIPIRVVITTADKRTICNMLATVDDGFTWSVDKAGDLNYSITLTEFPESKWDYINGSGSLKQFLKTFAVQSVAKKALSKVGLI